MKITERPTLAESLKKESEESVEPPANLPLNELAAFMEEEAQAYDLVGGCFIPHPVSKRARRLQIAKILRELAEK